MLVDMLATTESLQLAGVTSYINYVGDDTDSLIDSVFFTSAILSGDENLPHYLLSQVNVNKCCTSHVIIKID